MRATVLFCAAIACACSTKAGEPGSCQRAIDNACVDYGAAQASAAKRICAADKWTTGEKTCPTANRLGSCTKKDGAEWIYGGPPNNYTAASAKTACEFAGGVFGAGP
ncbi:MAG TPA: hypothetical protein VM925_33495 [Labilithrix sp.]|nr:hypothetical protein [Labilithrix sp.]